MKALRMIHRLTLVAEALDEIDVEPVALQHGVGHEINVHIRCAVDFLRVERTLGLTREDTDDGPEHRNVYAKGEWNGLRIVVFAGQERLGDMPTSTADIDAYLQDHADHQPVGAS